MRAHRWSVSRTDNAFGSKDEQLWSIIDVGGNRGSRGAQSELELEWGVRARSLVICDSGLGALL